MLLGRNPNGPRGRVRLCRNFVRPVSARVSTYWPRRPGLGARCSLCFRPQFLPRFGPCGRIGSAPSSISSQRAMSVEKSKIVRSAQIRDEPHTRVAPVAFLQCENADPRWAAHAFGAAETSRTPKWCGSSLHATQRSKSGPMGPIAPSCVTSDSVEDLLSANSSSVLPCHTIIKGGKGGRNLTQAETGRTNFGHSRTYSWRAGFVCGAPL